MSDNLTYSTPEDEDFEVTSEPFQKRAKHSNNILNHFWKWWTKEYLLEVRESHHQWRAIGSTTTMAPGDIVLVHEQDVPRGFWKLA